MEEIFDLYSLSNPVLRTHVFWSSILMVKVLSMSIATGLKKKLGKKDDKAVKSKSKTTVSPVREDVERIRRAHMNDMENIYVFILVGWIYILTNPHQWLAMTLIKAFSITRILHTLVYAFAPIPQPTRFIFFIIGVTINVYMGVMVAKTFIN
ncbi:hypothetical protein DMENIID0001_097110 [Sergentomyia squamirostris]